MKNLEDGSIEVEDWMDLQNVLFDFKPHNDHGRFRSNFGYRGVDISTYDLESSLIRIGNTEMETHLLRNFQKYTRSLLKNERNEWELLSVAQHYGLPTRLLDWSFSPYVALHFATGDISKFDKDGAIWCLDITEIHKKLPKVLREKLMSEKSYVFTVEAIHDVVKDIKTFDSLEEENIVLCLEPPSIDERIINQYAMFTVMNNPNLKLDELISSSTNLYKKIIIPSSLKLEIRDKLDQANINERMIFPGLQGISSWLKRYYTDINLINK
ncbi:FRG domain-containing protein [Guptibacillus hwajinpoensis]|uniref:FRG domain-containing protein n=1 Tax=Guptibacillus hwajinpoensis TaxID=208199 RepID=A0ABU0JVD8_9BACL|nr:FRG domain-containing protein [Alkalihalobacillus hemicentroti]MDQ0481072.1 hypothetical protein [Alkalihalobacillus hemicentroti]